MNGVITYDCRIYEYFMTMNGDDIFFSVKNKLTDCFIVIGIHLRFVYLVGINSLRFLYVSDFNRQNNTIYFDLSVKRIHFVQSAV